MLWWSFRCTVAFSSPLCWDFSTACCTVPCQYVRAISSHCRADSNMLSKSFTHTVAMFTSHWRQVPDILSNHSYCRIIAARYVRKITPCCQEVGATEHQPVCPARNLIRWLHSYHAAVRCLPACKNTVQCRFRRPQHPIATHYEGYGRTSQTHPSTHELLGTITLINKAAGHDDKQNTYCMRRPISAHCNWSATTMHAMTMHICGATTDSRKRPPAHPRNSNVSESSRRKKQASRQSTCSFSVTYQLRSSTNLLNPQDLRPYILQTLRVAWSGALGLIFKQKPMAQLGD
jgi:hypothetical protein